MTTLLSDALAGRTVITAVDRRSEELAAALERHGARVVPAAAMSTIPHVDDDTLLERTRALVAAPPDATVVLTGVGMRGWLEAADAAGLGEDLRAALGASRIHSRGTKAHGAVRGAGLDSVYVATSETAAELGDELLSTGVDGLRIAVQHHGSGDDGLDELLTAHGAEVISLTVYRWGPPSNPAALTRAVELAGAGGADAVLFTSAPGATGWLDAAARAGTLDAVRERARAGALVLASVGPVTSAALTARDLPVLEAERARTGSLVRTVVQHFAALS
ncbi:MAG TPA: uroporphyrinogen-III synthase [Brachybacterium paraconglomeratum]|uniref:Uroporphyrinogen-III synthase n=1 Tax=Brachybacterium paraconglomeratum TaxID=173362 RepID=A0A921KSM5_9MICO|nr:uroporphyrinogen-III synthase [Brachybacterium paraconglomeratum]